MWLIRKIGVKNDIHRTTINDAVEVSVIYQLLVISFDVD